MLVTRLRKDNRFRILGETDNPRLIFKVWTKAQLQVPYVFLFLQPLLSSSSY